MTFQVLWLDKRHSVCADEERSSTRTFEKNLHFTDAPSIIGDNNITNCWLLLVGADEPQSSCQTLCVGRAEVFIKQTTKQKKIITCCRQSLFTKGGHNTLQDNQFDNQPDSLPPIKVSKALVIWWSPRLSCQISLGCEVCQIVILVFLICSGDDWGCPSLKTFTLNMFNHRATNQKLWLSVYLGG